MTNTKIISFDDFAAYLNTLEGEHNCPMCQSEAWQLFTPKEVSNTEDPEKMIVPTIPGSFLNPTSGENRKSLMKSPSLNVLVMQCQNCGFMNFFNYKKVTDNIDSKNYNKKDGLDDNEQTEA